MPDFLMKTACRGHCPRHLSTRRRYARPTLIARLLRERHVARFVVAPAGFGKTAIALEYAETVFRFEHVFWIDGTSPCFLRDLDRGIVANALFEMDRAPFLAIFEDVPLLDTERVEKLSVEMDHMLDRGCEVLVTCAPTCDAFARHRDRVRLSATDLLLTNAEIDAAHMLGERAAKTASALPASQRVACLVWGTTEERTRFLSEALREELTDDLLLPMFVMLVLREGHLGDVTAFGSCDAERAVALAEPYPYLGIDCQRLRFDTAPFSMDDVASAFADKFEGIAMRSLFPNPEVFAVRVADALAARRRFDSACDCVRLLASRPACAKWLAARGRELLDAACLVSACEAYRSLSGEMAGKSARLDVDEACRLALLGDRAGACASARRVASATTAPTAERADAALLLARCAEAAERLRATATVATLSRATQPTEGGGQLDSGTKAWSVAASVHVALELSCNDAAETWLSWYDSGVRGGTLAQPACWILRRAMLLGDAEETQTTDRPAAAVERMAALVRKRVVRVARGTMGLFDALAGASYERVCEKEVMSLTPLDTKTSIAVRRMEMLLHEQRSAYERREQQLAERRRSFEATHPDVFRAEGRRTGLVMISPDEPMLTVNLFGGLDVRIGEKRVDPTRFRRQKVKTLLALLVLNRGREFSRDKLVRLLWPESDLDTARKNFYGIWSMLRRALVTPSGSCPYLIRQQQGLRLDASLLVSDVVQMEDVCRTLLFGRPGYGGWSHLLAQLNDLLSDDLLPSESENEAIIGLRTDYRNRLVDALVAAASRLVEAGEEREGLWFARAALQRDRTREDAYVALMRAQLAAGQRTAALETYFTCRRFLTEELGIDPSLETMRLYHSIIETEAELV